MDNQFYNFGMSLNVELVNNYNFIKYQYICQAPATFGTGQLTPVVVYGRDPRTEKVGPRGSRGSLLPSPKCDQGLPILDAVIKWLFFALPLRPHIIIQCTIRSALLKDTTLRYCKSYNMRRQYDLTVHSHISDVNLFEWCS